MEKKEDKYKFMDGPANIQWSVEETKEYFTNMDRRGILYTPTSPLAKQFLYSKLRLLTITIC